MSIQCIYTATVREIKKQPALSKLEKIEHLDVGAGTGRFAKYLLEQCPNVVMSGCDYAPERFEQPHGQSIEIKPINLDKERLPYADNSFDLVTCTEVLEHVENYRAVIREIYRVLKPNGVFVLSTPNTLNALSRWRILVTGFANLFGPLPFKSEAKYSTGGHIMPIAYFYMAHALMEADFCNIELSVDKVSCTSVLLSLPIWPLIALVWPLYYYKQAYKYRSISPQNRTHVLRHLSPSLMVGRTMMVACQK